MLAKFICLFRVIKKEKIKNKGVTVFFINVPDEIADLSLTYLRVRRRTQGYVVLGRNIFLLVDFNESYFVPIDGKILLATQNR